MSFWNTNAMEPLRQFRWYFLFGNPSLDNIQYALKKCDKPKMKVNSIQHKYMNHFYNFPGRVEWEDINVTFAGVTDPNAASILFDVLKNSGYEYPASPTNRKTLSKSGFVSNLSSDGVIIYQVDPAGTVVDGWKLINPFFTSVQFGTLDYSSEEIVEVTCVLKYDAAEYKASTF